MTDLVSGDYVLVTRPEDTNEFPGWLSEAMDDFHGTIQSIRHLGSYIILENGDGWSFNRKWCTKVSPPDSE